MMVFSQIQLRTMLSSKHLALVGNGKRYVAIIIAQPRASELMLPLDMRCQL